MAQLEKYKAAKLHLAFEVATKFGGEWAKTYDKFRKAVGGYNHKTNTLKPMTWDESQLVSVYLDSITGAVEAGLLDDEKWPQQLFKSSSDLRGFLAELSSYDDSYRINDRWWFALSRLANVYDEEGFIRTEDIADELEARVTEIEHLQRVAATPAAKQKPVRKTPVVKAAASKKPGAKKAAAKKAATTKKPKLT